MSYANAVKQWATKQKAAFLAMLTAMMVGGIGTASAEDPSGAEQAFTDLETLVSDFEGYAWPLVIAVMVALIGIKLFKKFASRAS